MVRGLLMCPRYQTCPGFTNQNVSCTNGPYDSCKNSLYGPVKSLDFEVFKCLEMGTVSPKACDCCRIRKENKCPIGKKEQ